MPAETLPGILRAGPEVRVRPARATFDDLVAAFEYEKDRQPRLAVKIAVLAVELHIYRKDHPDAMLGDLLAVEG